MRQADWASGMNGWLSGQETRDRPRIPYFGAGDTSLKGRERVLGLVGGPHPILFYLSFSGGRYTFLFLSPADGMGWDGMCGLSAVE